jgi:hypothetical protein
MYARGVEGFQTRAVRLGLSLCSPLLCLPNSCGVASALSAPFLQAPATARAAWSRDMDAGKAPITEAFPHVSDWKKGEMSDREVLRIMLEVSVPGLLGLWRWRDRYLQDTPLKVTFRDAHASRRQWRKHLR